MRNRNSVKQLSKQSIHRERDVHNMVTSLFMHERIVTTKHERKELKKNIQNASLHAQREI
jgi:ribosomal protein L17